MKQGSVSLELFQWKGENRFKSEQTNKIKPKLSWFVWVVLVMFLISLFQAYSIKYTEEDYIRNSIASYRLIESELKTGLINDDKEKLNRVLVSSELRKDEALKRLDSYRNVLPLRLFGFGYVLDDIEMLYVQINVILNKIVDIKENYKSYTKIKSDLDAIGSSLTLIDVTLRKYHYKNSKFDGIYSTLANISRYAPIFDHLFGSNSPQNTVFLFQNVNELRPSGGFIGSFALLKTNNGIIKDFKIHDIYEYDGQITNYILPPIEGMRLVASKGWSLRDTNINIDLKTSAENFNDFFEKSGGDTIDNFVFVSSDLLGDILKVFGELKIEELGISLNKDNYDFILEYFIESKYFGSLSPKTLLLNSFFNVLKSELFKGNRIEELSGLLDKWVKDKKIQLVSQNSEFNDTLKRIGLLTKYPDSGFIYPVFTSISGNKSDKYMYTNFKIEKINDNEFDLVIRRVHKWGVAEETMWNEISAKFPSKVPLGVVKDILGHGSNRSILTIYSRDDVEFLYGEGISPVAWSKDGFKVTQFELNEVYPGKDISLRLHFKHSGKVDVLVQPGLRVD